MADVKLSELSALSPATVAAGAGLWSRGIKVQDKDLTAPPALTGADAGKWYIVGTSATGDWAGHDGELAFWDGGSWAFLPSEEGDQVVLLDESNTVYEFTAGAWASKSAGGNLAAWAGIAPAEKQDAGNITNYDPGVILHTLGQGTDGGYFRITGTPTFSFQFGGSQLLACTATGNLRMLGYCSPINDGGGSSGISSAKWSQVYAQTGSINTSDARKKTAVAPLSPSELAAGLELAQAIGRYKWLAAIADKGESSARWHIGLTVQRVIEIMQSHGLDPFTYGLVCYDSWPAEYEDVETPVTQVRTVERPHVEIVDGQAVMTLQQVEVAEPVVDVYPLVDESGVAILDDDGLPATYSVPRVVTTQRQVTAAGDCYSLRHDELLLLITAAVVQSAGGAGSS